MMDNCLQNVVVAGSAAAAMEMDLLVGNLIQLQRSYCSGIGKLPD